MLVRIPAAAPLLHERPGSFTKLAAHCAMSNCSPVIDQSRPLQGYIDGDSDAQRRLVSLI